MLVSKARPLLLISKIAPEGTRLPHVSHVTECEAADGEQARDGRHQCGVTYHQTVFVATQGHKGTHKKPLYNVHSTVQNY